jgi:hypothetical protein
LAWKVKATPEILEWLHALRKTDRSTSRQIGAAIEYIKQNGPAARPPIVKKVVSSKVLWEIRPGSAARTEIRILFTFHAGHLVLLLEGGDKAGKWNRWYEQAIPIAEARYAEYVASETEQEES